jgi:tetratricopeptide (TPR) repeat protein
MARDAVDQLFTQVSQSPDLRAKPMEKFRKGLLGKAKEFYERFISEQFDAPGVRYDLALAHHRLGQIHRELGDYAAAEESSVKAIAALQNLDRAQPEVAEFQRDLAASYVMLGLVYTKTARWEKAEASYQQALAIQEKRAAANPEAAEDQYALANTFSALGLVHQNEEHPESAAAMCQQAQNILSKLARDFPLVSEYRSLLATTQMNLGIVYLGKSWNERAATALEEARGIYGRLVQGRPNALPEDLQFLARSHALLGVAYCRANRTEKAEEVQQQALRIFQTLAQEHPDVVEYAYDVGRCRMELGLTADRGGRPEVALAEYAEAIEILEKAVGKGYLKARSQILNARIARAALSSERGDHGRATEEVEALLRQEDVGALHVYGAACAFSRASAAANHDTKLSRTDRNRVSARYADRAVDYLREAVAKGFRRPCVIKEDRDLDPLRARDDFLKLLAELEKQTKE